MRYGPRRRAGGVPRECFVRAHLQADDAVEVLAAGGQHDDRRLVLRAHLAVPGPVRVSLDRLALAGEAILVCPDIRRRTGPRVANSGLSLAFLLSSMDLLQAPIGRLQEAL